MTLKGVCCQFKLRSLLCFFLARRRENFYVSESGGILPHHVAHFNSMEDENVTNLISNADSWNWLQKEIPLFECPDKEVEEIYYYRWWSFRKHLEQTPDGFVFTEFLTRPHRSAARSAIKSSEGRWLHDQNYSMTTSVTGCRPQSAASNSTNTAVACRCAMAALPRHR